MTRVRWWWSIDASTGRTRANAAKPSQWVKIRAVIEVAYVVTFVQVA